MRFIAGFIFASTFGAGVNAKTVDFKNALQLGLQNSPRVDSAKKNLTISELQKKSAVSKMLPSLDFSTSNGLQNYVPMVGASNATVNPTQPWTSTLGLGLTENLYDNGASLVQNESAEITVQISKLSYLKERDSVIADVAAEFYHYSYLDALAGVQRQLEAIVQKQFRSISSQYHQGIKTKSDFLRIKAQLQRAQIDRANAEKDKVESRNTLNKLLGGTDYDFEALVVSQNLNQIFFPAQAAKIEDYYDYKISDLQEHVDEKTVELVRKLYYPQLSVSSGVNYANYNYIDTTQPFNYSGTLSWNVLFALNYNIWDWGIKKRDFEIAEIKKNVNSNDRRLKLLDVQNTISNLYLDLQRNHGDLELTRDLLEMEKQSYDYLESQYRDGKVSYLDFSTGLTTLLDAKTRFYSAYFNSLTNLSKQKFYEGTIYENLIEK